jgi:hypothetical protein
MRLAISQCGVAAVLFLLPGTGISQADKPPQIPVDEPGLVHKQMATLAGDWDVEITYVIGGKEHKGKVRCESKWILDGRFLQQDYRSKLMGKPFTTLQLLGYDNQKKKTIEIVMNSMSTGLLHNEGTISADGKVIKNEGDAPDHATGQYTKLRTVTTIIDPDHYTLEWFHTGAGGKEEKGVSMTHTRRKQEASK